MLLPDASTTRASLTTVAVAATMHHIKVPRGSTVSKVEVILSDTMSQERWSRDQRWMGGLWKWHRQHISCSPLEYRSQRSRDLATLPDSHFSAFSFAARSNQPLPNLCVPVPFFSLFPRCRSPLFQLARFRGSGSLLLFSPPPPIRHVPFVEQPTPQRRCFPSDFV